MPHQTLIQAEKEAKEEYMKIRHRFRVVGGVAITTLVVGATFYHYVEDLSWIDSFYFCTITLTTIGYGDITPHTDTGKLFTIFYVLVGIGIIASFANLLLQNATGKRQLRSATKAVQQSKSTDESSNVQVA